MNRGCGGPSVLRFWQRGQFVALSIQNRFRSVSHTESVIIKIFPEYGGKMKTLVLSFVTFIV